MKHDKPLCFVLARGGSKRVPRKNVRLFCGKPMIAWPIEKALASGLFSSVVVSTEDEEIASIAREYGADVPFMRPHELADDMTGTAQVLCHSLQSIRELYGFLPRYCCCLYGTSAMLKAEWLCEAFDKLQQKAQQGRTQCVYAVAAYSHPIERALYFDADGLLQYQHAHFAMTRTQDIAPSYYDVGLFYCFSILDFLAQEQPGFSSLVKDAVVIPRLLVSDIDTEEDWIFSEKMASCIW